MTRDQTQPGDPTRVNIMSNKIIANVQHQLGRTFVSVTIIRHSWPNSHH